MDEDQFRAFVDGPDEETAEVMVRVNELLDAMPAMQTMTPQELREQAENNTAMPIVVLPQGTDRTIPGPAGEIPVRVFVPDEVDGVMLHIHGGGWIGGTNRRQDPQHWARAQEARVAVVSVEYRLAPEHPYPAANDDCEAAALWLVENAKAEFGTETLVIGGESAGAHLSTCTLLRMRDRHGYTGFKGAELRYGLYDARRTPSARNWTRGPLDGGTLSWILGHYVPEELREDPDVSPLLADLRDMPPALFTCGTDDSLIDDTLFMWARWRAAGNEAQLRIVPGGIHAFDVLPIRIAQEAQAAFIAFIRDCVKS